MQCGVTYSSYRLSVIKHSQYECDQAKRLEKGKNVSCTHVLDVAVYATVSFSLTRSLLVCMHACVHLCMLQSVQRAGMKYSYYLAFKDRHTQPFFKFNVYDPGSFAGKSPFLPVIFSFCSPNVITCVT